MIRRFPHGRRYLTACVGLLAWLASGTAAQVQDWKILLRMGPTPRDIAAEAIRLRPNVRQSFYFFVQKPDGSPLDDVLIRLTVVDKAGTPVKTLAETTVALPHTDPVAIRFGGPKPEAKPAEAGKPAPAPEPSFAPLPASWWGLGIEVRNPKAKPSDKPLAAATFAVTVLRPVQYVDITRLDYDNQPGVNRFVIGVTSKQQFAGPPCPVELVLQKELIPGLVPARKSGNLRQTIPEAGKTVELVAENLTFEQKAPDKGIVGVTVDGYPRAFLYTTDFTRSNTTTTPQFLGAKEPTVRLLDPRKTTVPVEKVSLGIEIDSPADANLTIEVGVDRNLNGEYEEGELQFLRGERQQLVSLAPVGPDGAVLLKAEVSDWKVDLHTAGVRGRLPYRVRVRDTDGKPIAIRDQGGQLITAADGIRHTLMFDDTPPEDLSFPNAKVFSRELVRGERPRVEAFGTDPESDIASVQFFVGKPAQSKDGKPELPANIETFKATKLDGKKPAWSARIAMPDRVGREFVSVQFVNGAGLSAFETLEVKLTDPAAQGAADQAKKFKISGKVVEGDRPQAGLVVTLTDDQGKAKATATTAKEDKTKGNFTFENVAPGIYTLSTSKVTSDTKGEAKATVEMSDVKDVVITLYR